MRRTMDETTVYGVVQRLSSLLDLLRTHSSSRTQIATQLPDAYPDNLAGRKRLQRDIGCLRQLGYQVVYQREAGAYVLQGGPVELSLSDEEVRALALIRETFTSGMPHAQAIHSFLDKLEPHLSDKARQLYHRKPPLAIHLALATDYQAYEPVIRTLERAIDQRQEVRFKYRPLGRDEIILHPRVEPLEIQYFDRHLYLVGYSQKMHQVYEYRIERIIEDSLRVLPMRMAGPRERRVIRFRYRLAAKIVRDGVSERFLDQEVEYLPNGDALVTAGGYSDFRIIREILRYGEQAEIVEPEWLRVKMREVVKKMAERYSVERDI